MNNLPFALSDVMDLCGVPRAGRLKNTACPFCGHRTSMYYDLNESVFHCFKCETKGGAIDFYREYMHKPDNRTVYSEIMHSLFGDDILDQKRKEWIEERRRELESRKPKDAPLRSVEERDEVYRAVLSLSQLSSDHMADLTGRGLTKKEIEKNGYKTLPSDKDAICKILTARGVRLDGIPGFYTSSGVWKLAGSKRGFVIPVRDRSGIIQGFQIRKDKAVITEDEGKYYWLSSKGYENGAGVPGAVHYACDFHDGKPVFPYNQVFLTEGALKGDIAHFLSRKPFLCVPGVNCLKALREELEYLKARGVETVNVCFDMDYKVNPNVQRALTETYKLIREVGLQPVSIEWDERYKGIDDYLVGRRESRKTA